MDGNLYVGPWSARFMGRIMPVATGRGGIGRKAGEGDGITPIGQYKITDWLIRRDRITSNLPAISWRDLWCDDPAHPAYNRLCHPPMSASHERLFRADHLYDLIGVTDYNSGPVIAGKGSAIFVHCWRRPRFPTEGCVAFAPRDLAFIAMNWRASSRLIIQD